MLRSASRSGRWRDTAESAPFGVDVWWRKLRPSADDVHRLEGLLSPSEIERAGRFAFELDRDRFVDARAALRTVLGSYLEVAPETVTFDERPNQKPSVSGPGRDHGICFSVSRSDGLMVCAVTRHGPVGVDVEAVGPWIRPGASPLSLDFLSWSERSLLGSRGVPRLHDVLSFWVAKEAAVKLTGDGLAVQPNRVAITSDASRSPTRAHVPQPDPEPHDDTGNGDLGAALGRRVWLRMLDVARGYVVGIAVPSAGHRVTLRGTIN